MPERILLAALVLALSACEGEAFEARPSLDGCDLGREQSCEHVSGCAGVQLCEDGASFGACFCPMGNGGAASGGQGGAGGVAGADPSGGVGGSAGAASGGAGGEGDEPGAGCSVFTTATEIGDSVCSGLAPRFAYICEAAPMAGCVAVDRDGVRAFCCPEAACFRNAAWDSQCAPAPLAFVCHPGFGDPSDCMAPATDGSRRVCCHADP